MKGWTLGYVEHHLKGKLDDNNAEHPNNVLLKFIIRRPTVHF
jgi:hypothetical protein